MNSWLLVRIAMIVVGIATLLRVVTDAKLVTYKPYFLEWTDTLRDIVGLGFLNQIIEPFLLWGIAQLQGFGFSVVGLPNDWQQVFVLLLLVFGAVSRNSSIPVLAIPWAFIAALFTSVSAGLVGNVLTVASMGIGIFFLMHPDNLMGNRVVSMGVSAATGVSGLVLNGLEVVGADPIVSLAVFALAFGAVSVLSGLLLSQNIEHTSNDTHWNNPATRVGMDIMSTLGLALCATYLANLPIG